MYKPPQTERQLLLLVSKGNQRAFKELFEIHKDNVYSFALYITQNDYIAEEITQEVFVKLWEARERLIKVENTKAYIAIIAKNSAVNHLKKMALERKVLDSIANSYKQGAHEQQEQQRGLEQEELLLKVHNEAINSLPPQQQKVYKMHHIERLKNSDIGQQLGISTHTVKEYLKISTKKVREHVSKRINYYVLLALIKFFN